MSSNSSSPYFHLVYHCPDIQLEIYMCISFMVTKFFVVVPLSILILGLGYRRWRRSFQASHSDVFAYHAAAFELIFGLAAIFSFCGLYTGVSGVLILGICLSYIAFLGEILLHILTCVERYLAVVHPIIYLGLRQSGGIRIRNISIGCVWLLSIGWIGVIVHFYPQIPLPVYFCILAPSLVIISFCSISVMCVLIRQGPGKVGGVREQADKVKRKAFFTITAILCVLLVFFLVTIVALVVKTSNGLQGHEGCLFLVSAQWFGLPLSVVLLFLFLQRAKEFKCCCYNNQ